MAKLIKAVLAPIIAFLYSVIIAHYPNFPIDAKTLLALVLWIISLFYSGLKVKDYHVWRTEQKTILKRKY